MILHRAELEELRDQTAVGVACGLHPGGDLEPVNQLGEWCSVDAGDDHERGAVATVPAVEPDVIADDLGSARRSERRSLHPPPADTSASARSDRARKNNMPSAVIA
ncbi:hypothetical protein [Streptomyces muensis]|uniref:Uncharacterized protein n=1 Tax=Streptomyces muensis TaxID=1077944 RepID=A0A9X1Q0I3_STRM4|nr:hypothetical protein [Streptomyces muensis]MCF1596880.1 hypothetical protein [Streptomyces muensis]